MLASAPVQPSRPCVFCASCDRLRCRLVMCLDRTNAVYGASVLHNSAIAFQSARRHDVAHMES